MSLSGHRTCRVGSRSDVQNHRNGHRLPRVGKLDDVNLSNVSSNRQSAGINADGFAGRRETTSVAGRRDVQPLATLARGGDGREANGGAGTGYGYRLGLGTHTPRGIEGDGPNLNKDWIAYRHAHWNGYVSSSCLQHLLPDVRACDQTLPRKLCGRDGNSIGSAADTRGWIYRDPFARIGGSRRDRPVQGPSAAITDVDRLGGRIGARRLE